MLAFWAPAKVFPGLYRLFLYPLSHSLPRDDLSPLASGSSYSPHLTFLHQHLGDVSPLVCLMDLEGQMCRDQLIFWVLW